MVSFSSLVITFSTIAGALAAPAELLPSYSKKDLVNRAPDFVLNRDSDLIRRQTYSTDYQTGGTVDYTDGSGGAYTVSFSDADDFVVGKGWATGSAQDITFSGSFSASSGVVLLSVYGWTTNPLVEYYITEDYTSAPTGTYKGTVTSDGATYDIYENTRTNEPSIEGTSTFNQYISVRTSKRSSGTVTTANHFNAWKSLGLTMGTFNYQVVATEGYNSASGDVSMTVS